MNQGRRLSLKTGATVTLSVFNDGHFELGVGSEIGCALADMTRDEVRLMLGAFHSLVFSEQEEVRDGAKVKA